MDSEKFLFRQLFDHDTYTYTYLIADPVTLEAAIIDTVKEKTERDLQLIKELGLHLRYVMDTHVHADHITGADDIRNATGAQSVLGKGAGVACANIEVEDGDEIALGSFKIKALSTPGHTNSCTSFFVNGMVFTGDALFVRGCGRTDFQQGDAGRLYDSIHQKLFSLPNETLVYPGHDYNGRSVSTIGEEKEFNPRLGSGKTKAEFVEIMKNLNLATPKNIQMALPANLACGRAQTSS